MDSIIQRQQIIRTLLNEVGHIREVSRFTMKTHFLFDDEHREYMLYKCGWKGERRLYGNVAHLAIAEDGKIWVYHDGTGLKLPLLLVEKGIPKSDIILAFHPISMRPDTGFGVS